MPAATEVSCPHTYSSPGSTGPYYICRGCGSLIANPQHPQIQAQGGGAQPLLVARPEAVNSPAPANRRRA